jgi:hypothetical protein
VGHVDKNREMDGWVDDDTNTVNDVAMRPFSFHVEGQEEEVGCPVWGNALCVYVKGLFHSDVTHFSFPFFQILTHIRPMCVCTAMSCASAYEWYISFRAQSLIVSSSGIGAVRVHAMAEVFQH